jgi:hypothetical protein
MTIPKDQSSLYLWATPPSSLSSLSVMITVLQNDSPTRSVLYIMTDPKDHYPEKSVILKNTYLDKQSFLGTLLFRISHLKEQYPRGSLFLRHNDLRKESSYWLVLSICGGIERVPGKTPDEGFDLRVDGDSLLDFRGNGTLYAGHSVKSTL